MVATVKPNLTRTWAAGAPGSNVVDPDTTTPGKFDAGWLAEVPPFEHFNFLQKLFTQGLAHNNEQGINVWDTNTTYPVDGLAKGSDGDIYTALVEQSANDPVTDDGTNWLITTISSGVLNFPTIASAKLQNLKSGQKVETDGYHDGWAASVVPIGSAKYSTATLQEIRDARGEPSFVPDEKGDHTLPNGNVLYLNRTGTIKLTQYGIIGGGNIDETDAFLAAVTDTSNTFNKARGVDFENLSQIRLTSTINITLANARSQRWFSEGVATIKCECPADTDYTVDVDFSTDLTDNFEKFDMENIHFLDPDVEFVEDIKRLGIRTKRVIGSRWVNCHFQNLKDAVDMNADSNLNHLDSCQFKGNIRGWFSTDGVANNNTHTNMQLRRHVGVALDTSNVSGTTIIGGDIEPDNANPCMILDDTTVVNLRVERNIQGEVVRLLDNCVVEIAVLSDGGTQSLPAFSVIGENNRITVKKWSGAQLCIFGAASKDNLLIVNGVKPLIDAHYIEDLGAADSNNIVETNSSKQSAVKVTDFGIPDNLAPADLTTWTSTGMTVTPVIAGQTFSLTNTGASVGDIRFTPIGTFTDLHIAVTTRAQQAQGRVKIFVDKTGVGNAFTDLGSVTPDTIKRRGFLVAIGTMTDPIIKIEIITADSGVGSDVEYIRIAEGKVPS